MRPVSRFFIIVLGLFATLESVFAEGEKAPAKAGAPGWVEEYRLDLDRPFDEDSTSDGVHYHLIDQQTNQGTDEFYRRVVYRLLTPDAVEENSSLSFSYKAEDTQFTLNRLTIHRGGKALDRLGEQEIRVLERESSMEENLYDGRKSAHLLLEDIRVGDVVDYAYTMKGWPSALDGLFFDEATLQYSVPLGACRVRHVTGAGKPFHYRVHGKKFEPKVTEEGNTKIYVWESVDLAANRREDDTPDWHWYFPKLEMSEFSEWSEVVEWGMGRYDLGQGLDGEIEERISEWKELPVEERVAEALRFVQGEVRYVSMALGPHSFQPYSVEQIWRRKFGDCKDKALLLATMLRRLGVAEAWPALVHTVDGPSLDRALPAPTCFDHVIVLVEIDGRDYWLDGTRSVQYGPLSQISGWDHGWALPLRAGQDSLKRMRAQAYEASTTEVWEEFEIADYGKAIGLKVRTEFRGAEADSVRRYFAGEPVGEIADSYLEYYQKIYAGTRKVADPRMEDDPERNVVIVHESYEIDDFLSKEEDFYEGGFSADVVSGEMFLVKAQERTMPLEVEYPNNCRQHIVVTFPEKPEIEDEEQAISHAGFEFSYDAVLKGRKLHLTYDFRTLRNHVTAEEFDEYREKIREAYDLTDYFLDVPVSLVEGTGEEVEEEEDPGVDEEAEEKAVSERRVALQMLGVGSTLAGFLLGVLLVVPCWFLKPGPRWRGRVAEVGGQTGLGGWLVLPMIALCVSPLRYVVATGSGLQMIFGIEDPSNLSGLWYLAILIEFMAQGFFLSVLIGLAVLFFARRWILPKAYVVMLLMMTAYSLLDLGLCVALDRQYPGDPLVPEASGVAVQSVIAAMIWIPYFMKSRRVRNTFTRGAGRGVGPPPLPMV